MNDLSSAEYSVMPEAFKDLIDRIRYEDRRLKLILDHLDIGILTVDRGCHINFFNSMAENITGFSREDILGMPCSSIFGKVSKIRETVADGNARSDEHGEIVTPDGRKIPIQAKYMALRHEDGRIIGGLATISDLSLVYQLNNAIRERYTFYDMVGKDPIMQKIFDILPVVATSDATVLIEGPTGTGKDVLARLVHNASPRSEKPMVKVNCAALPDNLLESEMFGYAKGAFTGADRDKPGRFQDADGGTLFLDEIGELSTSIQVKLLRVVQEKAFKPVGASEDISVDVRIIAATNKVLEDEVIAGRFREDLFYRLNVIGIRLPPLRERKEDIRLLAHHFLEKYSREMGKEITKLSSYAVDLLVKYDFPGNIRELENLIERSVALSNTNIILPESLAISLHKQIHKRRWIEGIKNKRYDLDDVENGISLDTVLEEIEKAYVEKALELSRGDKARAAELLQINLRSLRYRLDKLSIKK